MACYKLGMAAPFASGVRHTGRTRSFQDEVHRQAVFFGADLKMRMRWPAMQAIIPDPQFPWVYPADRADTRFGIYHYNYVFIARRGFRGAIAKKLCH